MQEETRNTSNVYFLFIFNILLCLKNTPHHKNVFWPKRGLPFLLKLIYVITSAYTLSLSHTHILHTHSLYHPFYGHTAHLHSSLNVLVSSLLSLTLIFLRSQFVQLISVPLNPPPPPYRLSAGMSDSFRDPHQPPIMCE